MQHNRIPETLPEWNVAAEPTLSIGAVNDTGLATGLFGPPVVPLERMVDWTVDWIERDQPIYGKPTRYESRDGRF